ncbi:phage tail sheath subtilisin-like domain-containing protein [soil metagenome]
MPASPSYPGVYIQEIDSGVRTVSGVATSIAAFVGRALRGPVNEPVACFNYGEFTRRFGGLWSNGPLSYAVDDFYANGGGQCEIVRLFNANSAIDTGIATLNVGALALQAASPGAWGNQLTGAAVHPDTLDPGGAAAAAAKYGLAVNDLFDLTITDTATGAVEVFRNLTVRADGGERRFDRVLDEQSNLVSCQRNADSTPKLGNRPANNVNGTGTGGNDGAALADTDFIGDADKKTGIYALKKADLFNLLNIPPDVRGGTLPRTVNEAAAQFCKQKRAVLLVDPPAAWDQNPSEAPALVKAKQLSAADQVLSLSYADYAALFFPRLLRRDPLRSGQMDVFPPGGAIAGVIARTDTNRGVWKSPAGMAATISGAEGLTVKMTDEENGLLNPLGVNCLRAFPGTGLTVWGARTLKGSDQLSDDYKYLAVRRLTLFIEESLYRGTKWVVFEGNDEPLWAQIRLSVGTFMQRLYKEGAFQGSNPRDAFFVKCDGATTTQDDRNRGIVNIVVGFAPLLPAEFVILSIQQIRNAA